MPRKPAIIDRKLELPLGTLGLIKAAHPLVRDMPLPSLDEFRRRHGEWTAHSIHLGDNLYTRQPAADGRLRRLLQIACDLTGKPIDQLRVLDLACLEGHYGIEFAIHGAEVVANEIREENLAKARFVKDYLNLDRLTLYQDDVRNLSREKYGQFDLVICSGILYHLDVPDIFHFIRRIYEVCTRLTIFDTHIALRAEAEVKFENESYYGFWYKEHDENTSRESRLKYLWSSVDNTRSFWFTPASLANFVARAGFTSFYECLNPHHEVPEDRRAYVAVKGQHANIASSPSTAAMGLTPKPERAPPSIYQRSHKTNLANDKVITLDSLDAGVRARNPSRDVGRNHPCPCGSGKKFKKCCMPR